MQVLANFGYGDSMASFGANVESMRQEAASKMEHDIEHMALPNQGRVSFYATIR